MFVDVDGSKSFAQLKKDVEHIKNTTFNVPIELRYAPEQTETAKKVEKEILDLGYEPGGEYEKNGKTIKEFF